MKNKKRWTAVGLAVVLGVSVLTGCGSKPQGNSNIDADPNEVVMTVGGDEVTLKEAYFLAKWQQAQYQTFANSAYGEDWYNQDLFDEGVTFQESIKEQVAKEIERMYICKQHMDEYGVEITDEDREAIAAATENFLNANDDAALAAMMADEELVERVLTNYRIYNKVYNALLKDVDTSVSDDEARQKTYSYIYQSFTTTDEDGNSTEVSASQQQTYYNTFEDIAAKAKQSGDFDQTAEDAGYSVASHSFGATDDDSFSDINAIADKMAVNDVSDVILVDGGLFLIKLDSVNDEEAAQSARQEIAQQKLSDAFTQAYEALRGEEAIQIDEELWAKVTFEEPLAAVNASDE